MKNTKYPEVIKQMRLHNQTIEDLSRILGISQRSVRRRITHEVEWTLGDVEILCKYYNMDLYKLFRKEN